MGQAVRPYRCSTESQELVDIQIGDDVEKDVGSYR